MVSVTLFYPFSGVLCIYLYVYIYIFLFIFIFLFTYVVNRALPRSSQWSHKWCCNPEHWDEQPYDTDTSLRGSSTNTTPLPPSRKAAPFWKDNNDDQGWCFHGLNQQSDHTRCYHRIQAATPAMAHDTVNSHPPHVRAFPEPHVPINGSALKCCSSKTGPEATCEHSRYMEICVYVYT